METIKIYQQVNSQGFHIGTSANYDWFINNLGALDVETPIYDKKKERARWDFETKTWIIKSIEEWGNIFKK